MILTRTCAGGGAFPPVVALDAVVDPEEDPVEGREREPDTGRRGAFAPGPPDGARRTAFGFGGRPTAAIDSGPVSTTNVGGAVPIAAGKNAVGGAATCKIPGPDG